MNNTKKRLKWEIDLTQGNSVLEEGIFKFLHPSGMPYLTYGDRGINGELDPGEAKPLQVLFCPGEENFLTSFILCSFSKSLHTYGCDKWILKAKS